MEFCTFFYDNPATAVGLTKGGGVESHRQQRRCSVSAECQWAYVQNWNSFPAYRCSHTSVAFVPLQMCILKNDVGWGGWGGCALEFGEVGVQSYGG